MTWEKSKLGLADQNHEIQERTSMRADSNDIFQVLLKSRYLPTLHSRILLSRYGVVWSSNGVGLQMAVGRVGLSGDSQIVVGARSRANRAR